MKLILKIFILILLLCSSSVTLWGRQQNIILTGSQNTGSYIFANELARLWSSSKTSRKIEFVIFVFECTGGSVAKLSVAIGMERTHLYRKLHALKIKL
jgi:transcriptional regulator of acetoin/glycerol metabolism